MARTEAQCSSCGETNPADSTFCQFCGAYLGWDEPGRAPESTAPAEEPRTAPGGATPAPSPDPVREAPAATGTAARREPEPAATVAMAPVTADDRPRCPGCGRPNEAERRFCGHCGQALAAAQHRSDGGLPQLGSADADRQEREARRAYRRSLPPLYRWRRVIVGVLVAGVVVALAFVLGTDPVGRVHGWWVQLTARPVAVRVTHAAGVPPHSVAPVYTAGAAVDGDFATAWATRWRKPTTGDCAGARAGRLVLTLARAVPVAAIDIRAGLSDDRPDKDGVHQPSRLAVEAGEQCTTVELDQSSGWQRRWVHLDQATRTLTISVLDVYDAPDRPARLVAVSEVRVLRTK